MANHKRTAVHRSQPQPALGAAIRKLRQQRGETLKTLAPKAGISWGTLGVIERGEANPTWGTVRAIAGALGVSVEEIAAAERQVGRSQLDGTAGIKTR